MWGCEQTEVQVLQSMHHPNIIHIEDVYVNDTKICLVRICEKAWGDQDHRTHQSTDSLIDLLLQVTEYMDGGELFDYIVEKGCVVVWIVGFGWLCEERAYSPGWLGLGGSLSPISTLSEVEASSFVRKITSAVAYMHACGVIHRDLKPGTRCITLSKQQTELS